VKIDGIYSMLLSILLSVPQGSVLGPLFFLLFINDFAMLMKNLTCVLFADDTTLSKSDHDLDELVRSFDDELQFLDCWCKHNRLDINWSKTYFMFVTAKRIKLPSEIIFKGKKIGAVQSFELLGVTIDNKLSFSKYVGYLKNAVNKKLHSIKRIFYLPTAVKIQFFKTFVMPYFDYCSSLFIYFSKEMLQKLVNYYNYSLFRLIGFQSVVKCSADYNNVNNQLAKYNLMNFQHRILNKLLIFSHKILNSLNGPINLKASFEKKSDLNRTYSLRNDNELMHPKISKINNHGERTFAYCFTKLINNICIEDINLDFNFFKSRVKNNINIHFNKFVTLFVRFDLNYKIFYK
jgi:hypothetical protein